MPMRASLVRQIACCRQQANCALDPQSHLGWKHVANYAYLCATDLATTYPSFVEENYDSDVQTVACDVYCIPLVWMALFRPQDLLQKVFRVDGMDVPTEAPLVERAVALRQLREALPYLNEVFSVEGPLDGYVASFAEAWIETTK